MSSRKRESNACTPGTTFRHNGNGRMYVVDGTITMQSRLYPGIDGAILVRYREVDGPRLFARELDEFEARFTMQAKQDRPKRCGQPGCPHDAQPGMVLCEGCWDLANDAAERSDLANANEEDFYGRQP